MSDNAITNWEVVPSDDGFVVVVPSDTGAERVIANVPHAPSGREDALAHAKAIAAIARAEGQP